MNLHKVDLNLLLVFEALMVEGSVTRAAQRIGVSQSAFSEALGRLRRLFGDELFVRGRGQMLPTDTALAIAEPVANALASVREALNLGLPWSPRTMQRTFRLGVGDYAETLLAPAILERLQAEAPDADLRLVTVDPGGAADLLDRGEIDLAADVFPGDLPRRLDRTVLCREEALCLVRRGHPFAGRQISVAEYAAAAHVVRSPAGAVGRSVVDLACAAAGFNRRVVCNVTHVLALPLVIGGSDLVATQPSRVAAFLASNAELATFPPPVAIDGWSVELVAGRRGGSDPAIAWLARLVRACAAALRPVDSAGTWKL